MREARIETRPKQKNLTDYMSKTYPYLNPFCTLKCLGLDHEEAEERSNNLMDRKLYCDCGDSGLYDWTWTKEIDSSVALEANNREITFHPVYSAGTAALRGRTPFQKNRHHYWEMKMMSNLYGTDVMVGVGTDKIRIGDWRYRFLSLLGIDDQSWGYSYLGQKQHNNNTIQYGSKFGFGSLIGVHLDMYLGKLEFYMNRKPLGSAYTGLKSKELYPMVSSTAALSSMKLTCSLSIESNLQLTCLQYIIRHPHLYQQFKNIPGLSRIYKEKFFWMLPKEVDEVKRKPKECVSPSKRRKIFRPVKMHFHNCDTISTEQ